MSGDPLILCSGSISPAKPLATVIEAFAGLARDRPGARLAIVGHATPERLESLRAHAAEHGAGGEVEVYGRVEASEYWDLLLSADLGLQLREVSNGEASAAVTDCIAARLPLLVSDLGWYGELPAGVAARVPPRIAAAELCERITALLDDRRRLAEMREAQCDYRAATRSPPSPRPTLRRSSCDRRGRRPMSISHCKVLGLEDFAGARAARADPLRSSRHEIERCGRSSPTGASTESTGRSRRRSRPSSAGGLLSTTPSILGVAAGSEPTIFWLTSGSAASSPTDLYATEVRGRS